MAQKIQNSIFVMTDEELKNALDIEDVNLVKAIYSICQDQYKEEIDRTNILDDKSKHLLSNIGVMLGIVFSVGGLTIDKIKNVALPIFGCPRPYIVALYLILGICLIASGILTYKSLTVRGSWRTKNEADIFRKDVLENGEGFYLQYMTIHIWKLYKNNFIVNEDKGYWLGLGQKIFIVSLFILTLMVVMIAYYANYV